MLKEFEVKNFKNFHDNLSINFGSIGGYQFGKDCITDNIISKMLIFGKNGTGKSNLGIAITDIVYSLLDFPGNIAGDNIYVNADSNDDYVEFKYTFIFNNLNCVIYKYSKFSDLELRDEELIIDGQSIFYCNYLEKDFNFDNLRYISESVIIDRYLDTINKNKSTDDIVERVLPFLKWLISNSALKSNSVLLKLYDYVSRISMLTIGTMLLYRPKRMYNNFFEVLSDNDELRKFEEFLNIMGVKCSLISKKLPDNRNELYFKHKRLIPFYENASSGTLALLNIYRRYFTGQTPSLMYLDEFDAFYHFEMAENLLKYLKSRFPNSQIIFTSHNTNLLSNRLFRPDCIFILSRAGKLTSFNNATKRELREGHNLEKMYISGEFENYE